MFLHNWSISSPHFSALLWNHFESFKIYLWEIYMLPWCLWELCCAYTGWDCESPAGSSCRKTKSSTEFWWLQGRQVLDIRLNPQKGLCLSTFRIKIANKQSWPKILCNVEMYPKLKEISVSNQSHVETLPMIKSVGKDYKMAPSICS